MVSGALPPSPCGVGDYAARLAEALARRPEIEVGFLSSAGAAVAVGGGGPAPLPPMADWGIGRFAETRRAIRAWRPDIVHLQYPTQGYGSGRIPFLIPLIAWSLGVRVVRTWHEVTGWDQVRNWRNVLFFFLQAVVPGAFITVRPDFAERLHPLFRRFPWKRRYELIPSASTIPRSTMSPVARARFRRDVLGRQSRLIVFFGFLYPQKGAELVFDLADPATDHIVFVGGKHDDDAYAQLIEERARSDPWIGKAEILGFRSAEDIADLLAAADAVVLPFQEGSGSWNTSLHAAILQGAPVVTTSVEERGYKPAQRVSYSMPGDTEAMRTALAAHAAPPSEREPKRMDDEWERIADAHLALYERTRWI